MQSVYDSIYSWARKTNTSFGELCFRSTGPDDTGQDDDGLVYRLKHWPELPADSRKADVFRTLSVMSHRPVNRHWILTYSKLQAKQVDVLLERLIAEDAVEVIDVSKYGLHSE